MKVSVITLFHNQQDYIPLIKHNYENFTGCSNLELIVIDDGNENLIDDFKDLNAYLESIGYYSTNT